MTSFRRIYAPYVNTEEFDAFVLRYYIYIAIGGHIVYMYM
jgi:hypothetical protein